MRYSDVRYDLSGNQAPGRVSNGRGQALRGREHAPSERVLSLWWLFESEGFRCGRQLVNEIGLSETSYSERYDQESDTDNAADSRPRPDQIYASSGMAKPPRQNEAAGSRLQETQDAWIP